MHESPIRFDHSSADIQAALTDSHHNLRPPKSRTKTTTCKALLPPCYHNEKGLPVRD